MNNKFIRSANNILNLNNTKRRSKTDMALLSGAFLRLTSLQFAVRTLQPLNDGYLRETLGFSCQIQ